MAKHHGVQVGQQYVNVHSTRNPPPIWEVKSTHPGDFGISHAGLMNSDDPLDKKTVSEVPRGQGAHAPARIFLRNDESSLVAGENMEESGATDGLNFSRP